MHSEKISPHKYVNYAESGAPIVGVMNQSLKYFYARLAAMQPYDIYIADRAPRASACSGFRHYYSSFFLFKFKRSGSPINFYSSRPFSAYTSGPISARRPCFIRPRAFFMSSTNLQFFVPGSA